MDKDKVIDISVEAITDLIPAFASLKCNPLWIGITTIGKPFLRQKIEDTIHWGLGLFQRKKVYYTANCLCENITENLNSGKSPREDGFFNAQHNTQIGIDESSASKLTEGTFLKAKEEYDSKKLPFISFLTANIFFAPNISEDKAFVLLEILSKLTYRQLCALYIFYKKNVLPIGKWEAWLKGTPSLQDYYHLAYEFLSLKDYLLIESKAAGVSFGFQDYRISALGKDLVITANLTSIPKNDIREIEDEINFITSSLVPPTSPYI